MKKFFILVCLVIFLSGCGALAKQSEFWKHDSVYASKEHLWFSWFGWKKPGNKDSQKSGEQNWWGIDVKIEQQL